MIPYSSSYVTVGGYGKIIDEVYDHFREIEAQGFVSAHSCYKGKDWVVVFIHTERTIVKPGVCCLCGWTEAGTRDSLVIQVPKGIPALYATHREDTLRRLFTPQE